MTTAMDFLEPQICRRQCDYLNDLEKPLLEATSSTAEGEHEQEMTSVIGMLIRTILSLGASPSEFCS
jgi:hypothetical protein